MLENSHSSPHSKNDFGPNAVISKDGSVFLAPANRRGTNNCKPHKMAELSALLSSVHGLIPEIQ
jgi:hypothetical protein